MNGFNSLRLCDAYTLQQTIIGSYNGLSPGRRQSIIWTNAGILLIRTSGTNFCAILSEIHTFTFKKKQLKIIVCEMAVILPQPHCVASRSVLCVCFPLTPLSFIHIVFYYFTGQQCQRRTPKEHGKCSIFHEVIFNHNKAKHNKVASISHGVLYSYISEDE